MEVDNYVLDVIHIYNCIWDLKDPCLQKRKENIWKLARMCSTIILMHRNKQCLIGSAVK